MAVNPWFLNFRLWQQPDFISFAYLHGCYPSSLSGYYTLFLTCAFRLPGILLGTGRESFSQILKTVSRK